MTTVPHLTPVPDKPMFRYPIAKADRLDGHSFVKWQHQRWLASALHLMASYEVQGMARALFDLSQSQSPPGTLPQDRAVIARMLRIETHHLDSLCRHAFGPLHGWQPCICDDGEVRLYHAVVLEQVRDAFDRREAKVLANNAKAIAARRDRLVAQLRVMGCDEEMLRDDVLMDRMNGWLDANWKRRRDLAAYQTVLDHAAREGWLGRPRPEGWAGPKRPV